MKKNILLFGLNFDTQCGSDKVGLILFKGLEKTKKYNLYYLSLYKNFLDFSYLNDRSQRTNFIFRILNLPFDFFKLYRFCKKNKIDIIISQGDFLNILSILLKFFIKIKVISTIHIYLEDFIKNKFVFLGLKYLYKKSDKVVCVSKKVEEFTKESFNLKNTLTIYNPFQILKNLKLSKKNIDKRDKKYFKKTNKSDKIFLNIGRLEKEKGQWFLIRSFKKVVEKYPNSKLIILGDGSLRKDLQNLIRILDLKENIFLIGVRKNVFKYIKKSDCFLFTSLWESFGLVLVESLILNKPIILTDCLSGPREILASNLELNEKIKYPYFTDYGILLNNFEKKFCFKSTEEKRLSNSEKDLSKIILKFIEDKDLQKKYLNGIKRAKDFDINRIINKWEELLK